MARKNRTPEEKARRERIRELLQMANIGSMDDIQNLFKETIPSSVTLLIMREPAPTFTLQVMDSASSPSPTVNTALISLWSRPPP